MSVQDKSVLIVDDDPDICEAIASVLSAIGLKTITAFDGAQAIQKFNKQYFDLVITDINMPKANGVKLIQQVTQICLKEKQKTPPFIVISGDLSLFKNYLEKLDNVEILPKPFDIQDLLELSKVLISGRKKQYVFKLPDELVLLVEKIMAKVSNSLLGKEVNNQGKAQAESSILEFDGPFIFHLYYKHDRHFGKIAIEMENVFIKKILTVLSKNEKFQADTALKDFVNIISNVFTKSIEKKFLNMELVDTLLTQGYANFLNTKKIIMTDTGDYRIYNIKLQTTEK
jgi:DNA-binding response OmpR family regulator